MLDFREIPKDGNAFELMTRELLFGLGYHVQWSGIGPDAGKDLVCTEQLPSRLFPATRRWLVQCKHYAHSGKSVGLDDLDEITDSCSHHGVDGYLLVCSTYPSSHLVERFEGITVNTRNLVVATYWDAATLERLLATPRIWGVAQTFFPASSGAEGWQVYGTDSPNHWIVVNKDLYVHVCCRVGSSNPANLQVVRERLDQLATLPLPDGHFFRLRAIYYDDKHAIFNWYIDYMRPAGEDVAVGDDQILRHMGAGYAYGDGQIYEFDVLARTYSRYSDHYDPNHYHYYDPYIGDFACGRERAGAKTSWLL